MNYYRFFAPVLLLAAIVGLGCSSNTTPHLSDTATGLLKADAVRDERAKLSAEDRVLVDAQEWCVSTDERLGSMGPPLKLDIKGQPVFVCCKGCKKKAEADPDKTLAKVAELQAKATAMKSAKK